MHNKILRCASFLNFFSMPVTLWLTKLDLHFNNPEVNFCHSFDLDTLWCSSIILSLATPGYWLYNHLKKPSDCEQHSWQQPFFLPHHWQHCLAMVTKVNIHNGQFFLCWVVLGLPQRSLAGTPAGGKRKATPTPSI